jgi:hypothetical protein
MQTNFSLSSQALTDLTANEEIRGLLKFSDIEGPFSCNFLEQ